MSRSSPTAQPPAAQQLPARTETATQVMRWMRDARPNARLVLSGVVADVTRPLVEIATRAGVVASQPASLPDGPGLILIALD